MIRIAAFMIVLLGVGLLTVGWNWHSGRLLAVVSAASADPVPVVVGEIPAVDSIYFIEEPGIYGLGPEIPGSRYAIVADKLVRLENRTNKILSILRSDTAILD